MRKRKFIITQQIIKWISLFFGNLFFFSSVFAGAWVQPEGSDLFILNNAFYRSCVFWDANQTRVAGPCYDKQEINPYFEYGLTPRLTIGASGFARDVSQSGQRSGWQVGDLTLFGRYELWRGDYNVLSTQFGFNIPFTSVPYVNPLPPEVSLGQYALSGGLVYGSGGVFPLGDNIHWYANVGGGYQENFNGAANQLYDELSFGIKFWQDRLIFELKEYGVFSLNNQSPALAPNYDLITLMPNVMFAVTPQFVMQLGFLDDILGQNVGAGKAVLISLWWRSKN